MSPSLPTLGTIKDIAIKWVEIPISRPCLEITDRKSALARCGLLSSLGIICQYSHESWFSHLLMRWDWPTHWAQTKNCWKIALTDYDFLIFALTSFYFLSLLICLFFFPLASFLFYLFQCFFFALFSFLADLDGWLSAQPWEYIIRPSAHKSQSTGCPSVFRCRSVSSVIPSFCLDDTASR